MTKILFYSYYYYSVKSQIKYIFVYLKYVRPAFSVHSTNYREEKNDMHLYGSDSKITVRCKQPEHTGKNTLMQVHSCPLPMKILKIHLHAHSKSIYSDICLSPHVTQIDAGSSTLVCNMVKLDGIETPIYRETNKKIFAKQFSGFVF